MGIPNTWALMQSGYTIAYLHPKGHNSYVPKTLLDYTTLLDFEFGERVTATYGEMKEKNPYK